MPEQVRPGRRRARGVRRLTASRAAPTPQGRGGARALRPNRRRTRGLPGTLGMTLLGAVVPGSGYLYAGRKALGAVVLTGWLAVVGVVLWWGRTGLDAAFDFAFDPTRLRIAAFALATGLVIWAFVVFTSYRLVRPRHRPRWHTIIGNVGVGVVCLVVAAPVVLAARYAVVQADLVTTIFEDNQTATAPDNVTEENPWAGQDRVNVLLLGGDGGEGRTGVRTDTMILVSMDTTTGKTVMFSLPRNMMNAQFPEDSPLHDLYPDGYGYGGSEDPGFYMLNAVYGQIPERHPGILGKSDNEGADAIKQAVSGSLGIPVQYYLLVNLEGFKEVVDAMGGVTVNINEPVAIGGDTDAGIPPDDYLDPGPSQHLDGFQALWFSRGRYGSDDYARMERQRCMIDALIDEANPLNLIRRYTDLAAAGKEIVFTDIPIDLAPAFADLSLEVKGAKVKSIVFRTSDRFTSAAPDYDYMHTLVQRALNPPPKKPNAAKPPKALDGASDACAYRPTDNVVATD